MSYRGDVGLDGSRLGGLTQEGTVVSNMPLLFANGYPTCLGSMTETQLEKFIPFMIHCALGVNPYEMVHVPTPTWWPCSVRFRFPLVKPDIFAINGKWTKTLKSLVHRCYVHHECQFMLNFSDELVTTPVSLMKFIDLCDGTTELRDKRSGKLLVTFRNENRAYDREPVTPRRHMQLMPRTPRSEKKPPCPDIYLCESCDAEFETLAQVQSHEEEFHQSSPGPAEEEAEAVVRETRDSNVTWPADQADFLRAFGLVAAEAEGSASTLAPPPPATPKRLTLLKPRHAGSMSFNRCSSVPISSPMGRLLLSRRASPWMAVPPSVQERIERYCSKPFSLKFKPEMPTRTRQRRPPVDNEWYHTYSFSREERKQRYAALNTGLDRRSRHLLTKCKKLQVVLKKLTQLEIKMYAMSRKSDDSGAKVAGQRRVNQEKLPWRKGPSCINLHDIPIIDLCVSSSSDEELPEGHCQAVPPGVPSGCVKSEEIIFHQITRNPSSAPYRLNIKDNSHPPACVQKRVKCVSSGPSENRVLGIPFLARKSSTNKLFHLLEPDSQGKLKELNKIKTSSCVSPKVNWSVTCGETL